MKGAIVHRGDLDRTEEHLKVSDEAIKTLFTLRFEMNERLSGERYGEIQRRLEDLNNSHEKAVEEKRRTDRAALEVQERTVTRVEFQGWKDEVNRTMATQSGASTARAAMLSSLIGFLVIVINIVIRYTSK